MTLAEFESLSGFPMLFKTLYPYHSKGLKLNAGDTFKGVSKLVYHTGAPCVVDEHGSLHIFDMCDPFIPPAGGRSGSQEISDSAVISDQVNKPQHS
jgi:acyl-coenzyme A synthetase/AMP-(fatty) acid ligase